MSLLDAKAQSELLSRITGNNEQQEQTPTPFETALTAPSQINAQPRETYSQTHEPQQEQPQMIPYDRFKKVNETKKEYQKRYEDQQREIEKLRKEIEDGRSNRGSSSDDKWLEELLGEAERETPEYKYKTLEQRLQTFELKEAERELSGIVKSTQRKNSDLDPDLVESVVYQVIAENPTTDVDDAVDRLRDFIGYVQTSAVKKPQVTQQEAPRPTAAPRPTMSGTKHFTTESSVSKPKTLADARDNLYNFLKNNKF